MATAAQYRRAQAAAEQRRTQHFRSRRGVTTEEWQAAFTAVEALKRLAADEHWLHAVRVFQSEVTGDLELEAQVSCARAGATPPSRIGDVAVRVRCLDAANQANS